MEKDVRSKSCTNKTACLVFTGCTTDYSGEYTRIHGVEVAPAGLSAEKTGLVLDLTASAFANQGISITAAPGEADAVVYIGRTDAFDTYGDFAGVAETIGRGGRAFVNMDDRDSADAIAAAAVHELAHLLLGMKHSGSGLAAYAADRTISSGETVSGLIVETDSGTGSYSTLKIEAGGTAVNTTVNAGGIVSVYLGGRADTASLNDYGIMNVYGSANALQISGGASANAFDGANVASATLLTNGYLGIESGAVLSGANVSGGSLAILEGASADGIHMSSGGRLSVSSGAAVSNLDWTPFSGMVNFDPGADISFTSAHSGFYFGSRNNLTSSGASADGISMGGSRMLYVFGGGTVSNLTVNGTSAMANVFSGGLVETANVTRGDLKIFDGGSANTVTVNAYGRVSVGAGAAVSGIAVQSGGILSVLSGGTAAMVDWTPCVGTIQEADGAVIQYASNYSGCYYGANGELISSGAKNTDTLNDGCNLYVFNGGSAAGNIVSSGGLIVISNGGAASNPTLFSGASAKIYSGGIISSTIVSSGKITINGGTVCFPRLSGGTIVMNAGYASSMWVSSGGLLDVHGGTAELVNVFSAGNVDLTDGVLSTVKLSNGGQLRMSGGSANAVTIQNGGELILYGGTATQTKVSSGASITMFDGLLLSAIAFPSTTLIINGGMASAVELTGSMSLKGSGLACGTLVNAGGAMQVNAGASASGGVVRGSNAVIEITSGGAIDGTAVERFASLIVSGGGTAANIVWTPCEGTISADPDAVITFASSYAGCYFGSDGALVSSALVMNNLPVETNECLFIFNGGSAANSILNDGTITISSGGILNLARINGGVLDIFTGGEADNLTMTGGELNLASGGIAFRVSAETAVMRVNSKGFLRSATVGSAANIYAEAGGSVFEANINSSGGLIVSGAYASAVNLNGGSALIMNGGYASGITASAGGSLNVLDGGSASALNLADGGAGTISGGGLVKAAVVQSGGILTVLSGGTASDVVWTPCVGEVLEEDGAVISYATDITGIFLGSNGILVSSANSMTGTILDDPLESMYIMDGGLANQTKLTDGRILVSSGGNLTSAQISGGTLSIRNSGSVQFAQITGGVIDIAAGGSLTASEARDAVLSAYGSSALVLSCGIGANAILTANSGATVQQTAVSSGGIINLSDNSFAYGLDILADGTLNAGGQNVRVSSSVVSGAMNLSDGAYADQIKVIGSLCVNSGALTSDIQVASGGAMTMKDGAVHTGGLIVDTDASVFIQSGANIVFSVDALTPGNTDALIQGFSSLSFTRYSNAFSISVKGRQPSGVYLLADNVSTISATEGIAVYDTSGAKLGVTTLFRKLSTTYYDYSLSLADQKLSLTIERTGGADTVYVNSDWPVNTPSGTIMTLNGGGTATYGINAFSSMDRGYGALNENGTLVLDNKPCACTGGFPGDGATTVSGTILSVSEGTADQPTTFSDFTMNGPIFGGGAISSTPKTNYLRVSNLIASSSIFAGGTISAPISQNGENGTLYLAIDGTNTLKMVFGGSLLTESAVLRQDHSLSVEGDTSTSNIVGGDYISHSGFTTYISVEDYSSVYLRINTLSCSAPVIGGSMIGIYSNYSRSGNIFIDIQGGVFQKIICGGCFLQAPTAYAVQHGNTQIDISGGTFLSKVYAGSAANLKNTSKNTRLIGDTNICFNADDSKINIDAKIFGGGSGQSIVEGNSVITFSGSGENYVFSDKASVTGDSQAGRWNGVFADGYWSGGKYVSGDRKLEFDRFTGDFAGEILIFDTISFRGGSEITFSNYTDLTSISNWLFTDTGSDDPVVCWAAGANDFTNDTISVETDALSWTLINAGNEAIGTALDSASSVILNGETALWNDDEMYWSTDSYKLYFDDGNYDLIAAKIS